MADPIRILLVDDQRLMREGLRILLELEADLKVVGEAEDGQAGLETYENLQPDVVLMDVRMPGMDGVEATRRLRERWPEARVIILTTFDDDEYVFEGLRAGAQGYLLKGVSGSELAEAVRTVNVGGTPIEPWVTRKLLAEFAQLAPSARGPEKDLSEPLSEREQEVLRLLAQGLNNREIAARLSLSEGTIEKHVTSILQKMGVSDRTQAAMRARELAIAGRIQEGFFPEKVPHIPGWQLAAKLEPARETSGDFYDFIPLPNGRLGIVVADVADKGAGAALYMTSIRTLIRTFAVEYATQPELALSTANDRIVSDTHTDMFVTVFYGILDPVTATLTYCNAGHNPPYLLGAQKGNVIQALRKTGMPLGIHKETTWGQDTVQFAPGDVLVLYTDGLTEAQNVREEFFGEERLLKAAQANRRSASAQDMQEALLAEVHEFVGHAPQFDDLTLVVVVRGSTEETNA